MPAGNLIVAPATTAASAFNPTTLAVSGFTIRAGSANTGNVYIGSLSSVTTTGMWLAAGEAWNYASSFKEPNSPLSEDLRDWYMKSDTATSTLVVFYFK